MNLLGEIKEVVSDAEAAVKPVAAEVAKEAPSVVAEVAQAAAPAVEKTAAPAVTKIFDQAYVDLRNELPGLMAKLGVNTSDESSVLHGTIALVVSLLEAYGPAEIRDVLKGSAQA